MFKLTKQQTKVIKFNPRAEKHGDNNVLAGDLKLETTVHSSVLDNFDKGLRPLLYRKPAPGEQSELPLEASDGLTARKMPQLAPLVWDEKFPGYRIEIESGLAVDETLKIADVEIKGFEFEALDGGSVRVTFSAAFHPDGRLSGKLCQLIQDTVELTLTPPSAEADPQQQELAAA
jgi:hypothetical protein